MPGNPGSVCHRRHTMIYPSHLRIKSTRRDFAAGRSGPSNARPCTERHRGPFVLRHDEMDGWLGLRWFDCVACGSTLCGRTRKEVAA